MLKRLLVAPRFGTSAAAREFAPVAFDSSSRLTFKRLRSPTRLPRLGASSVGLSFIGGLFVGRSFVGRYLDRLNWLFGG